MNLRRQHSLKKKIPWETAISLTLHQVKSNVEIAGSKSLTGDNWVGNGMANVRCLVGSCCRQQQGWFVSRRGCKIRNP